MIAHVVLFQPRSDLGAEEREALVEAFSRAIREIPSIRRVRVGRRVTHGRAYEKLMAVDYQYGVILEFDDVSGLKAYLEHPAHASLGDRFFTSFAQALMYDFEFRDGVEGLEALVTP